MLIPKRIGPFLRELAKVPVIDPFSLPAVAQIRVVADDRHHPALVVKDRPIVRLLRVPAFGTCDPPRRR